MKIVTSHPIVLSHEEVIALFRARHVLEGMADNCVDTGVYCLIHAITDCLDILSGCYEEKDS